MDALDEASQYEQLAAGRVPSWWVGPHRSAQKPRKPYTNVMGRRKPRPVTLPKLKCLETD